MSKLCSSVSRRPLFLVLFGEVREKVTAGQLLGWTLKTEWEGQLDLRRICPGRGPTEQIPCLLLQATVLVQPPRKLSYPIWSLLFQLTLPLTVPPNGLLCPISHISGPIRTVKKNEASLTTCLMSQPMSQPPPCLFLTKQPFELAWDQPRVSRDTHLL